MNAFRYSVWIGFVVFLCGFHVDDLLAQQDADFATQEKVAKEIDLVLTAFSDSPEPITDTMLDGLGTRLVELKSKAGKLKKTIAVRVWIQLLEDELDWYSQQSVAIKTAYSKRLYDISSEISDLSDDESRDSKRFFRIIRSIDQVRQDFPKSANAISHFNAACANHLKHGRSGVEAERAIEAEIGFRSAQLGQDSSLIVNCMGFLVRTKFELGKIKDARAMAATVDALCADDDLLALKDAALSMDILARNAFMRNEIGVFELCVDKMHSFSHIECVLPQVEESIELLDGWGAVIACDVVSLIGRGEAINPDAVSTRAGCERLSGFAIGLYECGESARAEAVLRAAFSQLCEKRSEHRHLIGFALAKLLSYDERWDDAAEVLDSIRHDAAREVAPDSMLIAGVNCQWLWISANRTPAEVNLEAVNSLRSEIAKHRPFKSSLSRCLDLTEALVLLNDKKWDRASKLVLAVKQFDESSGAETKCASVLQRLKLEAKIAQSQELSIIYDDCMKQISQILDARKARHKQVFDRRKS